MPESVPPASPSTPEWQSAPSQRLAGKVAMVTGIGSGIAQACALLFARQGAAVYGCDINSETAQETAAQAAAAGFPLAGVTTLDLTNEPEIARWVADVTAIHGGVDILVNAGGFSGMGWIEEIDLEDFRRSIRGEVEIVFSAIKAVWEPMKRRGGGSIINFASANAHHALRGSPALAHVAAKGAILAMSHQLAMEGAPHGIRANSISPGLVVTGATRDVVADPDVAHQLASTHMISRLGQPIDIAWAAVYLASDESSWVTASEIRVDGGTTHW